VQNGDRTVNRPSPTRSELPEQTPDGCGTTATTATWTISKVAASTKPNDDDIRHTVRAHQRSTSSYLVDVSQRTDFKLAQQADDRAKSQVTTVDLGVDPMAPFQF
jgi:hypothetical protein